MESLFYADNFMAQRNESGDNLTDFNQEPQQKQMDQQKRDARALFGESLVGKKQNQDDYKNHNEGDGSDLIQTLLQDQVSQQGDACGTSTSCGAYFIEDRRPDNQIRDEMGNFKGPNQIGDGDRTDFDKMNSCSKVQDGVINSSDAASTNLRDGGIVPDQNDGCNVCRLLEQKRDDDDDFIPLSNDRSPAENKIYVGKISNDTDKNDLWEHFSKFGEVTHVQFRRSTSCRKTWNFGFITFASKSSVDSVMKYLRHVINGSKVIIGRTKGGRFLPKPRTAESKFIVMKSKRIYVGGLKPETTKVELLNYFDVFGKVQMIELPFNKKNKPKKFCIVTFEREDSVDRVCEKFFHIIGGTKCRVKRDRYSLREVITYGQVADQSGGTLNASSESTIEPGRTVGPVLIPRQSKGYNITPLDCILS